MKYRSAELRDALAAEYVLGTLRGRARRRFEHSLRTDPMLREHVRAWQARMAPLDAAANDVQPPAHVWDAIERRIGGAPRSQSPAAARARTPAAGGFWSNLAFWRGGAFAGLLLSLVLGALLAVKSAEPQTMVVIMEDQSAQPKITVSWEKERQGGRRLRLRVIGHQTMEPNTTWELWMLPEGGSKPVSLGLINTHETQSLRVPRELAVAIDRARGLAMSVEPAGGSPTGSPTGPVLYKGECVQL